MSNSVVLDKQIDVQRPLEEVFSYVSEFSNIEQWDPAVQRASRLTAGPVGEGSEFRVDMKAGFSLHYRVVEFEENARVLMAVDSRLFSAREEIFFAACGGKRSTVRYVASFQFGALMSTVNSVYPQAMERVGEGAMAGLKSALEDGFEAPQPSAAVALGDKLILPGLSRFTKLGYRLGRRQWRPVSANMRGRHVLITGATSGIGLAAAEALAAAGATLTLVARNRDRGRDIVRRLREASGNKAIALELCDLSLMSEVHALCDRMLRKGRAIDVLVNNAGALFNPRKETGEGFEKSFALLLLGPYILTERLQPLLAKSEQARVINVSSGGMYSQRIQVKDLQSERGSYSGSVAYARAKRGLVILTEEWARRWRSEGIVVNAMHPGWADTPGVQSALPGFHKLTRQILRTPQEGADTIVWLAAATEAGKVSGEFWLDRQVHPTHVFARTRETAAERKSLLDQLAALSRQSRASAAA